MKFCRSGFMALFLIALSLSISIDITVAQTILGRISGTVTDTAGKALTGVKVTVVHQATQLTREVITDDQGFYVVTNLPIGDYTVTAENQGFKKLSKTNNTLVADGRLTVDLALEVGELTESVEITSLAGETVNTTSGEIARVVDSQQVQNLALNARNYQQLVTLIPGSAQMTHDALGLTTSLNINETSVNGNRRNSNLLTVDGAFNMDSGSNASQINNVGIDFIQEVKMQTSNFSAEYGRNSGASINVVTRSGTNAFHGSAFEYLRNDKLDARNFFAPRRSKLRFNDFGWSLGGPIIKDKFFFFGGMEWKKIRQDTTARTLVLPTRAQRAGIFGGSIGDISSRITPNGRAIANVYNSMERLATSYNDTTGRAVYQLPNPFDFRQEIVRLDYRFNEKHSIYGRYIHDNYDLVDPFGTFINSDLPTTPTHRLRPGYSYQVGYNWVISPQVINDIRLYAAWSGQRVPVDGDTWRRETYGFTYPQIFTGGRYPNGIPNVNIGGFANFRGPAGSLIAPTTDIGVSEDLTVIKGKHTLKTGLLVIRNRKDQNGRPFYTGFATFTNFSNALLGNFTTYEEASADPMGFFRFSQVEAYISDNWKVSKNLSLELGVRYQYFEPIYTQANNISNFDPSLYNPAAAVRVLPNGNIDPASGGDRYNGLVRVRGGIPGDQAGRIQNLDVNAYNAIPDLAPRGLFHATHKLAPRLSFAWTPFDDNKTAIRGGAGMFYDRPEGNLTFSAPNLPPFLRSVSYENGNLENPTGGSTRLVPFGNIDAIDPNLEIPYSINWSLSVQRELPRGFFAEVGYVGNVGRHLIRQPDINQPRWQDLAALPSSSAVNSIRPYKGFSEIRMRLSDAISNYHGLQLYGAKRKGDLNLTASYTFSKVLTDASSNANSDEYKDYYARHLAYGPAQFDRRHIFVSTFTYSLPFFRTSSGFAKAALGDWEVSGVTRLQSGPLYTPTVSNSRLGRKRADYVGGPIQLSDEDKTLTRFFNTSAFRTPPEGRQGNAGTGIIEGPGWHSWDLSLRKRFAIKEDVRLQLQMDLFNAFNRANFMLSNNLTTANLDINTGTFGQVISAAPGRNIQLGLRLDF
jgi:hypothetical protein